MSVKYHAFILNLLLFITLCGKPPSAYGQHSADSTRAAWLSGHVISLDQDLAEEGTVSSLGEIFRQTDVVAMGEPTHGDGTAFQIRTQLSSLLHTQFGYSRLVLEGLGMFDPSSSLIEDRKAYMWTGSEEGRSGLEYFLQRSEVMEVRGFDIQHDQVDDLFEKAASALESTGEMDDHWTKVSEVLRQKFRAVFAPVKQTTMDSVLTHAKRYVRELRKGGHDASALFLENAAANASVPHLGSMQPRDRQMAGNLLYLRQNNPEKKTIVWGASSHLVKSLAVIDNLDPQYSYDEAVPAGAYVAEDLKEDYYVIGFTACGGSYAATHIGLSEKKIEDPPTGSLEEMICRSDFRHAAFVDLRSLAVKREGEWLRSPLLARPLGYTTMRASWPLVLDALIVVREMRPSTPIE